MCAIDRATRILMVLIFHLPRVRIEGIPLLKSNNSWSLGMELSLPIMPSVILTRGNLLSVVAAMCRTQKSIATPVVALTMTWGPSTKHFLVCGRICPRVFDWRGLCHTTLGAFWHEKHWQHCQIVHGSFIFHLLARHGMCSQMAPVTILNVRRKLWRHGQLSWRKRDQWAQGLLLAHNRPFTERKWLQCWAPFSGPQIMLEISTYGVTINQQWIIYGSYCMALATVKTMNMLTFGARLTNLSSYLWRQCMSTKSPATQMKQVVQTLLRTLHVDATL